MEQPEEPLSAGGKRAREEDQGQEQDSANKRTFMDEIRAVKEAAAEKKRLEEEEFQEFLKTQTPIPNPADVAKKWVFDIKERLLGMIGEQPTVNSASIIFLHDLDAHIGLGSNGFRFDSGARHVHSEEKYSAWKFDQTKFADRARHFVECLKRSVQNIAVDNLRKLEGLDVQVKQEKYGGGVTVSLTWDC